MDETILDFSLAERTALRATLEEFGIEYTPDVHKHYSEVNLSLWKRLEKGEITRDELKRLRFEIAFGRDDGTYMNARWMDNLAECGFYLPGAREFLDKLAATDIRVFIITNGLSYTQNGRIRASGLIDCVEKIYISEEMGAVKPDPLFADIVIGEIGDPDRSRYLVAGDSLSSDILLAENAGLDSCLFVAEDKDLPAGYRDHDITYIAHGYDELLSVILS